MAEQEMGMREYRKGNWTVQETMILIEAKKMDDERRKLSKKQAYHHQQQQNIIVTSPGSNITSSPSNLSKPVTELRWKWVEEYCWRKGCLRSQNQCNDKWDNLMRDYKKIRDYQRSITNLLTSSSKIIVKGYWEMDKIERKDKGLPTNMLPQIYQALFEVVEQTTTTTTIVAATTQLLQTPPPPPPPPMLQQPVSPPTLRLQTQLPFYSQQPHELPHLLPTLESEAISEHSQPESSSSKRRRKEERVIAPVVVVEGTTTPPTTTTTTTEVPTTTTQQMATTTTTTTSSLQEVSLAISRSASIISEVIQANEEKQERRHREIMHLHETRLRFEESKLEVTRQGFNGLTDAINKLANSILTLANTSHKSHHQAP